MEDRPSTEDLREKFNSIADGSECISFNQFQDLLALYYITPGQKDLDELLMFRQADENKDSQLSFEEVENMFNEKWQPVSVLEREFLSSLDFLCQDKYPISQETLKSILQNEKGDCPLTDEDVESIFSSLDFNDDKMLTQDEIRKFIFHSSRITTPDELQSGDEPADGGQGEADDAQAETTPETQDNVTEQNLDSQGNADDTGEAQEEGADGPQENADETLEEQESAGETQDAQEAPESAGEAQDAQEVPESAGETQESAEETPANADDGQEIQDNTDTPQENANGTQENADGTPREQTDGEQNTDTASQQTAENKDETIQDNDNTTQQTADTS